MSTNRFRTIRLNSFNANTINRTSGSTGEIIYDSTNGSLRVYTSSSTTEILATRNWVADNSYVLPTATTTVLGGVKVDGTSIIITNGTISAAPGGYSLPTATTTVLGGVKIDGISITIDGNGVISSSGGGGGYVLPTAGVGSGGTLGGVKVDGTSIIISNGVISAVGGGGGGGGGSGTVTSITAGTGLSGGTITSSGTIAVDYTTWRTGLSAESMTVTSLSDTSGTINFNAATSRMATVTVTGTGRTFANPTNLRAGSYIIIIQQDSGGSKTITNWGSAFKWPAGIAPVLSTTSNTTDIFSFWCDGTNLYGTFIPDCR